MTETLGTTVSASIDMQEILKRIPHRYPFLLVDRAEDYQPFKSVVGIKCVTMNEFYFQGHFPDNPVMPGVLIVEALGQTGAVLMSKSLNADVEGKKFAGRAYVNDKVAAEAEFAAMVVKTPE